MRATIDKAGRVVIPKSLRERAGLAPGNVDVTVDGSGVRIEAPAGDELTRRAGRRVIPPSGACLDEATVQALRDADQR